MKTMMLATAAVLGLGVGAAFADSEGGTVGITQFTQLPGVVAQAPVQNAPAIATAQSDRVHVYSTQSNHGTWLFAPYQGNG